MSVFIPEGTSVAAASSSIISMPASRNRVRATGRIRATMSRSRAESTCCVQVSQRPHATSPMSPRSSPHASGAPAAPAPMSRSAIRVRSRARRTWNSGSRLVDGTGADGAVAEDEVDLVGARDAEAVELVDICRELHKRRDAGGAGELGVLHAPTTVVSRSRKSANPTNSSVANAAWNSSRVSDLSTSIVSDTTAARAAASAELARSISCTASAPNRSRYAARTSASCTSPSARGTFESRVFRLFDSRHAAELRVDRARPRELAFCGRLQVARAPDDALFLSVDPHVPSVAGGSDTSPRDTSTRCAHWEPPNRTLSAGGGAAEDETG